MRFAEKIEKWKQDKIFRQYISGKNQLPFMRLKAVYLSSWLKFYQGDTSRLTWLEETIAEYIVSEEPEVYQHVFFDKDDNMLIDEIGILHCSEILEGFFGKEETYDMYQALKTCNRMARQYHKLQKSLMTCSDDDLQELIRKWSTYPPDESSGLHAKDNALLLAKIEAVRRESGMAYKMNAG